MRKLQLTLVLAALGLCATAHAQNYVYPIPWPYARGGTLVAVPVSNATVTVYHWAPSPHASGFDQPFPFSNPTVYNPQPAGQPIILGAPPFTVSYDTDEDDFYLLQSTQPLVLSVADDERLQFGTPDRIFFLPSTTGTFRGRVFYGLSNADDPAERIRVTNLGQNTSNVDIAVWTGTSWQAQGSITVPPGTDNTFDPTSYVLNTSGAYRVTSSEDALVVDGYLYDNATAPAVDVNTGLTVGNVLYGYGGAYFLRAVDAVSYTVETRDPGSTAWTTYTSGTLAANEGIGSTVPTAESYIRITLTGGKGWAIVGTASLLNQTEWNGYFLPTQSDTSCVVGKDFYTNSSARTVSMLPNHGTTVNIYDEASGTLEDSYTSTTDWEFHNFFWPNRVKVEFVNGPGAVLLVGTLNYGDCDEATNPGNCGILEGGYSVPPVTSFRCDDTTHGCTAAGAAASACGINAGTTTTTTTSSGGSTGSGSSSSGSMGGSTGGSSGSTGGTSGSSGSTSSSTSTSTSTSTTTSGSSTSTGSTATTGTSGTTGSTVLAAGSSSGSTSGSGSTHGSSGKRATAATGCGCSAGSNSGLDALLLGLAMLGLRRRRRS